MIRIFYRVLFVLFLAAGALQGVAQNTDVSVWVVDSELSESTVNDGDDSVVFDFEEDIGWGLSFNRHWTRSFSTELSLQKYGAEMNVTPEGEGQVDVGDLEVTSLTLMGQWHFRRDSRLSPYVGAGLSLMRGEFEFAPDVVEDPAPEQITLEREIGYALSFGANVNLTDHLALTGEMKFTPWDARERDGLQLDEPVEVDPVTFSAGVRFRF
ncbi:MAG TPA: OmpW family outer membrane protein [Thermoanaerobaculia bacterium]|nr:OmpW family outer membrane protein [Thermoanaerobaculia bacterium]